MENAEGEKRSGASGRMGGKGLGSRFKGMKVVWATGEGN